MGERIPFANLGAQHEQVAPEIAVGWQRVLQRSRFILGAECEAFERDFASFQEVAFCAGVANGTDALELAGRALGLGAGDEVIMPANTFAASALAFMRMGAKPVFVDCDARHLLIDPEAVARSITPRTRAVLAVHLFGQMAEVEKLCALLDGSGIHLIEDAAQSQGARRLGRAAGAWGIAAATSFYPGKNLGAYGDAGAVLTNSPQLDAKVRALRNYGSTDKYHHPEPGFNSRLDELQAVVLNAKLKRLSGWNAQRNHAARVYDALLSTIEGIRLPALVPENEHVWHLYVVRVPRRDAVLAYLHSRGIEAAIHYPTPLHLQGAFSALGQKSGELPVAEQAASEILSLPLWPGIDPAHQQRVADELAAALRT